jgi:ribosomal protein S1
MHHLNKVLLAVVSSCLIWLATPLLAEEGQSAPPTVVRGKVVTIEKEWYVVKDQSGKEVRLHVDPDTAKGGSLQDVTVKVGDTVEAYVLPDGHAQSLNVRGGRGATADDGYR